MSLSSALRALGNTALDLLTPPTCPGCSAGLAELAAPGAPSFCPGCELAIAPRDPAGCASCDAPAVPSGLCERCRRRLLPLRSVQAVFEYEGPIAAAIQRFKYQGREDLLRPLTRRWLAEWSSSTAPAGFEAHLVVPVPLHPRRLASRGFDQAWLLARGLAKAIRAEARPRALRRLRATPPQVGLGRQAREENVRGAFAAEPLSGREVLIVDDVLTTGATLRACAEALVDAGAVSVSALVVARAQP